MILWFVLFLLVIAISFILALQSMRDYQEIPQQSRLEYSLFLIRRTENLNQAILDSILELAASENSIISIERLFKGNQTALTIFGPKSVLEKSRDVLGLLELEDYVSNLDSRDISAWEIGARNGKFNPESLDHIFSGLPALESEEQFFWQVVLGKSQTQIRAALYSKDPDRRKALVPSFQNLASGQLIKVPKPFSGKQMMDFYRLRSLSRDSKAPVLGSQWIIRLLEFS